MTFEAGTLEGGKSKMLGALLALGLGLKVGGGTATGACMGKGGITMGWLELGIPTIGT